VPDITLYWSRATVSADGTDLRLRVPLLGKPDGHWLAEFESLRVSRHLQARGAAWIVEDVGDENVVTATGLVPGEEAEIREAIDAMVAIANDRTAQIHAMEDAELRRQAEDQARAEREAGEMTARFRALDPAPAREEVEVIEPDSQSALQDRMRVISNGRETAL
jgi:hypothetical protein